MDSFRGGGLGEREAVARIELPARYEADLAACTLHPAVLDAYLSGVTLSQVEPVRAKAMKGLLDAEARLVSLLLRMDRKAKAA